MKVSIWTAIVSAAACCVSVLGGAWMLSGELGQLRADVRVLQSQMDHVPERVSRLETRITVVERVHGVARDSAGE